MLVLVLALERSTTKKITCLLNQMGVKYLVMVPEMMNGSDDGPEVHFTHIIVGGGSKATLTMLPSWIIKCNQPVMGIGHGMHLIAQSFGAHIKKICKEEGKGCVTVTEQINGQYTSGLRYMNRCSVVMALPERFRVIAITDDEYPVAFTDDKKWWCYQYHPECPEYGNKQYFRDFLAITLTSPPE